MKRSASSFRVLTDLDSAILVIFNSVLQIVLFAPYSLLVRVFLLLRLPRLTAPQFCNYLARSPGVNSDLLRLSYPQVSRAVGIVRPDHLETKPCC